MSREDARRMQDQIYVQASIITGLEKRIEELARHRLSKLAEAAFRSRPKAIG
ncbi:hypothetical protein PINS_up024326 [Pythium insidiosum]|nr:hypothetical protein PINS_up024326 [Pythium insidiosum]